MGIRRNFLGSFAKKSASLLAVTALSMLMFGCTPGPEKISKIRIDVPLSTKNVALNTLELQHLVINVSGGGLPSVILYTWSACRDCAGPQPAPAHVIEVPSGTGRLIQVLALYNNTSSNLKKFYYGDQVADLAGGDVSVNIPVLSLSGEQPLASGSINGRFVDGQDAGVDFGPSGSLEIRYQPEGKPSMIVERSGILNGWFSAFGLANVPLRYVIAETGRDLFGQTVDLYNSTAMPPSDRVAKFSIPAHTRVSQSGGSTSIEGNELEPTINILGFFGPGARAAHKVCYQLDGVSQGFMTRLNNVGTFLNTTQLSLGSAFPSVAMLASGSVSTMHWQGGVLHSTCGSDAVKATGMYRDFLPLQLDNLTNGREGAGGFYYPFGRVEMPGGPVTAGSLSFAWTNGSPLLTDLGSTGVKVAAAMLPGARSILDRVDIFKVTDVEAALNAGDHYAPCGVIAAGGFGSTLLGSATLTSNGQFLFESAGYTQTDADSDRGIAICFNRIGLGLAARGAMLEPWMFGPGGGNSGPYLRVQVYGATPVADKYNLIPGVCYQAEVKNYSPPTIAGDPSPDSPNTSGAPWNFAISTTGWAEFSTSSSCSAATGSLNVSITNGASGTGIFYFRTATTGTNREFVISPVPSETIFQPQYNRIDVNQPQLGLLMPSTVGNNLCYPVRVERRDHLGNIFFSPNVLSFNIDNGSGTSVDAYSTMNDCVGSSGGFNSWSVAASMSSATIYFKASTGGTLRVLDSAGIYTSASSAYTVDANATNRPAKVVLEFEGPVPSPLGIGVCYYAAAKVVNDLGAEVAARTNIDVNLSLGNDNRLLIYPTGCMSAYSAEQKVTINFGESRRSFAFKITGPSSASEMIISSATLPFDSASSLPLPSIQVPTDRPGLSLDLPGNWYNRKIGTHEFRTAGNDRAVNVAIPSGATIGFSCPTCTAGTNLVGTTLLWHSTDALNGRQLMFTVGLNGMTENFILNPTVFFGPEFGLISCGQTITAGTSTLFTTTGASGLIVTNTDSNPHITNDQTLCLGPSLIVDATNGFTLQANSKVIGWSDGTSTLRRTNSGGAVLSSGSFGGVAANLRLEYQFAPNSSADAKGFALVNPTGSPLNPTEVNNVFVTFANETGTSFTNTGVSITGSLSPAVKIRDVTVVLGSLGTNPGAAVKTSSASQVFVDNLVLRSNNEKNSALDISNVSSGSANSITVNRVRMGSENGATNGRGRLLWGDGGASGSNSINLTIRDAAMVLHGTAALNSGMVRLMNYTSLTLESSYLVSNGAQPLIYVMDGSANLFLTDNILVQLGNYPLLYVIPGVNDVTKTWMMGGNQFIRPDALEGYTAVPGSGYSMIHASGMTNQQDLISPGGSYNVLPTYGNSICLYDNYGGGTSFANASSGTWGGSLLPGGITPLVTTSLPIVGGRPFCR